MALVFFSNVSYSHHDGDIGQPQHIYRTGASYPYHDTPQEACQTHATAVGATVQNVSWNSGAKRWACTIVSGASLPSTINFDEAHCNTWDKEFSSGTGSIATSCDERSDTCAAAMGHTENWIASQLPWGFNVPDEDGLPPPWDQFRNCAFKLQGFTPNGQCTTVNYTATGSARLDEDAGPGYTAVGQGDPYQDEIPPDCDPDTGNTTSNGPQQTSNTCLQRAGQRTVLAFDWNGLTYPEPPDAPAWQCVRSCKAVPDGSPTWGSTSPPTAWIGAVGEMGVDEDMWGEVQYIFPFEDHVHYGSCVNGTEAPTQLTPRGSDSGEVPGSGSNGSGNEGGSGGGGTDVTGIEDRLDALAQCIPERGDICSEFPVDGEVSEGEPGHDAMDDVAEDGMGQSEAAALDDDAPAWSEPLTGWASAAGTGCQAISGTIMGATLELDLCDWAERTRSVLYFVFGIAGLFYCFGAWRRASEV